MGGSSSGAARGAAGGAATQRAIANRGSNKKPKQASEGGPKKKARDDTGVWAGYTPAAQNEKAGMNINCQNCILYAGGTSCKILAMDVEPMGMCRFALIPDGVVNKNG